MMLLLREDNFSSIENPPEFIGFSDGGILSCVATAAVCPNGCSWNLFVVTD